jgi:glycosyltransferase involved in cell wall biosynthesis
MKYSILMTVYNRPQLTLMNTMTALGQNDLADCEIVVIDDASDLPYDPLIEQWSQGPVPFRWIRIDTKKERPDTYQIDGHNNPAYAWNRAVEEAQGENVILLSSDCMPQAWAVSKIKKLTSLKRIFWHPCVYDLGLTNASGMTGKEFCGVGRVLPLGWMLATAKKNIVDMGGWDEGYLKGIACEDNDFAATLALHTGRFVIDKTVTVWHQSHPDTAYSDERKGWNTNMEYTQEKWGGVPFYPKMGCPLQFRQTEVNEQLVIDCELKPKVEA